MRAFLAAALASVLVSVVLCDHWALLVAGSNGYYNYRHQADICHAYHILHNHGIPDDRIVVMMYDDIADSAQNPFPGNIINRPGGKNVYPGVLKDYTGHEVTPDVFLKVLTGDKAGLEKVLGRKGKVIESGPNDNVFVYFADHGAPGLIAFPDDELHAPRLNKAILEMHDNKQYKKMVFYVEACESGSMFEKLLRDDINVYATTASNAHESSYAIYYDKTRKTYLGDVYSVYWMQDSDAENLNVETLKNQFAIVKKRTNTSHVMEYGDLSMGDMKVAEFQGNLSRGNSEFNLIGESNALVDAIPSEFVPVETLRRQLEDAVGRERIVLEREYRDLLRRNEETVKFFEHIVQAVSNGQSYRQLMNSGVEFTDFTCYIEGIQFLKASCPGMKLSKNDIALRNLRVLANLCESGVAKEDIWFAIKFIASKSAICSY